MINKSETKAKQKRSACMFSTAMFVPCLFHFCSTFVPLLFHFCSTCFTFVPLVPLLVFFRSTLVRKKQPLIHFQSTSGISATPLPGGKSVIKANRISHPPLPLSLLPFESVCDSLFWSFASAFGSTSVLPVTGHPLEATTPGSTCQATSNRGQGTRARVSPPESIYQKAGKSQQLRLCRQSQSTKWASDPATPSQTLVVSMLKNKASSGGC